MSLINWTKSYRTSDQFFQFGGADLGNIQTDITNVVNGSLDNLNVSSIANINESKIAFDTSSGHNHDGNNSRLTSAFSGIIDSEGREGLNVTRTDNNTFSVGAGSIVINQTILTNTATTSVDNDGGTGHGTADDADSFVYVYCFDNSGSLGFLVSHLAPNLVDYDQNDIGTVFRYRCIGSTIYRCLGGAYNDSSQNLQVDSETSFDSSSFAYGATISVADIAIARTTIWTPSRTVWFGYNTTTAPVAGGGAHIGMASKRFFDNQTESELNGDDFRVGVVPPAGNDHHMEAMTAQTAGTPGSFKFRVVATGEPQVVYWWAFNEELTKGV